MVSRVSAEHAACGARVRVLSRLWPRDQAAGLRVVAKRPGCEHPHLQRRRRDRTGPGAYRGADSLGYWRTRSGFLRHAFVTNAVVMACGFVLVGYQLSGYFLGT